MDLAPDLRPAMDVPSEVGDARRASPLPRTALEPWPPHDFWMASFDGVKLHARDEGPRGSPLAPVLCLPGLTRNARDFDGLSAELARDGRRPRRVLAVDYRGRGLSDPDPNWRNYNVLTEARDCLDLAAAAGLDRFVLVGTSRGGLIAMIIGALRPSVLAGVVLNDVGPVIEGQGIARIKTYLLAMPEPKDWDDAVRIVRGIAGQQFTELDEEGWLTFARRTFRDEGGRPMLDFDRAIVKSLAALDLERGLPTLWPQFEALRHVPVLVVRGQNSDLLAPGTVELMAERHPNLEAVTVPGVGHAPFLTEPEAFSGIARLLQKVDRGLHDQLPPAWDQRTTVEGLLAGA